MHPDGSAWERIGLVTARRLEYARAWRTATGDLLHALPGDWWVVSDDGVSRSVAPAAFDVSYRQISGHVYRRTGRISARMAISAETVATREGEAQAMPGDWIATDAEGNCWPISPGEFARSYRALDNEAEPAV